MQKMSFAVLAVLIGSACAVYHDRYGTDVAVVPEFWGTVTFVDPVLHRIDIDYIGENRRHHKRVIYFDERTTRWDRVRYSELRPGDEIWVRARHHRGRWDAESIRRH